MSALTPWEAALVEVSSAIASREEDAVDVALAGAVRACDPVAVDEAILQTYLFLGYPASLNAFARWRALGVAAGAADATSPERWAIRGEEVCRAVYGAQYEALRPNIRALHPDMERWMVEEGYGKVLGRPGLGLPQREICIAALLAVLGTPRQLYSHLRGALNVGASQAQVSEALEIAFRFCSPEGRARAEETWAQVKERSRKDG